MPATYSLRLQQLSMIHRSDWLTEHSGRSAGFRVC